VGESRKEQKSNATWAEVAKWHSVRPRIISLRKNGTFVYRAQESPQFSSKSRPNQSPSYALIYRNAMPMSP